MDVFAGGEIHYVVGTPANRPSQLFNFFADAGSDGRVADIGVYFYQEIAADNHRFDFRVINISGDNGATTGNFIAYELGRNFGRNAGAERLAGMLAAH